MNRPSASGASAPDGDPWAAFGYLVSGVACYGLLGWGVSVWLHAGYWIPVGILVGLGFGMYMVFARYRFREPAAPTGSSTPTAARRTDAAQRPESNDRGDTA